MFRVVTGAFIAVVAASCGNAAAQGGTPYNWSGVYGGVSGGYAAQTGRMNQTTDFFLPPGEHKQSLNGKGVSLGGYVGYNFLVTPMVLIGAEAEAATIQGSATKKLSQFGARLEQDGQWMGSLRGRVGLALDRTLIYANAGVAYSDAKTTMAWVPVGSRWTYKAGTGRVLGLGIEQAVTSNIVLRLEGSAYDFGSGKAHAYDNIGGYEFKGSQESVSVRGGVAYKF
ncbi:outer membrane protein [Prosthecodimorpha staleyi]|uniref:Outer membrane protein OmpA-like transmembrane domain-containing protein n=1 Tax=Prosthecodimorpha staleyi TaxID=2840188 RepID=A0A947D9B9_9HYPH|nr:hypothetical protein [Prosthecodimorpha staleyi]MBT9289244.1 hypothetical protein [Prosthecodimorpha staleyi]